MQKLKGAVEKLSDENGLLRQQAGMAAADHIDVSGVQLAKVSLTTDTLALKPAVILPVWHIQHDLLTSCSC